jgi:hypothetical protein
MPIAAMVVPTPIPAAVSAIVAIPPAAVTRDGAGDPIFSVVPAVTPAPVETPVAWAVPAVPPAASPALPTIPAIASDTSAIVSPKIYEQQILAGQNEPTPAVAPAQSAQPEFPRMGAPSLVAKTVPAVVADPSAAVLPTVVAPAPTANPESKTPDVPTPATRVAAISVPPQPGIVAINPAAIVPASAPAARSSTTGGQPVSTQPDTTFSPAQMPVVDVAPVAPDEIVPANSTDPRSQLPLPTTAAEAGFPWQQTQGTGPVEVQAIFTQDSERPPLAGLRRDESSLRPTTELNSADVMAATPPSPMELRTPTVPTTVSTSPAAPLSVPEISVPVTLPTTVVANAVLADATTSPVVTERGSQPVLPGQKVPASLVASPVPETSPQTPVAFPPAAATPPVSGDAPTTIAEPSPVPARAGRTKSSVATGSQPGRTGKRPRAAEIPAASAAVPVLANTPALASGAVAPTLVTNLGIPATVAPIAPVLSAPPASSQPNAAECPSVVTAVLTACETAVSTNNAAVVAPRFSRPSPAIAGGDLGSALAASRTAISTSVASEPEREPTSGTGTGDVRENRSAPAALSGQAPMAEISQGTPANVTANPLNLAPAAAAVPTGLPDVSSPVSARDATGGTALPPAATVGGFPWQYQTASRSSIRPLRSVSADALPAPEDADPLAPAEIFTLEETVSTHPTAGAVVSRFAPASDRTVTTPPPGAASAFTDKAGEPSNNLASPISPGGAVPARVAGSGAAAIPAGPTPTFAPPAAIVSAASDVNAAPAVSRQGTEAKPEPTSASAPAVSSRDAVATPVPGSNSGEIRSQPTGVAADAATLLAAAMPVAAAVPEKFAVPLAQEGTESEVFAGAVPIKNTIGIDNQQVEIPTSHTGINAAKKSATMLSNQPQSSSATPAVKSVAPAADVAARVETSTITTSKPEPSRTAEWVQPAGRTLAIVRDVAERMQTTANRVVEFDVSSQPGTQLSVRLEYRGGVVHTTFRTDSTELRTTLAREWQSAMPTEVAGERSVRLAEPTFAPASALRGGNQSLDLGGQSPRQQQQDTPQSQDKAAAGSDFGFPRGASARRTAVAAPAVDTPVTPALQPDTAQHLHAFA